MEFLEPLDLRILKLLSLNIEGKLFAALPTSLRSKYKIALRSVGSGVVKQEREKLLVYLFGRESGIVRTEHIEFAKPR